MATAGLTDLILYCRDGDFARAFRKGAGEDVLVRVADGPERFKSALSDFVPDLVLLHTPTADDLVLIEGDLGSTALPPTIPLLPRESIEEAATGDRLAALGMGQYISLPIHADELWRRVHHFLVHLPRPKDSLQFRRLYRAGEPIFLENEIGHECYRIVSGRVRICKVIDRHTLQEIAELRPGDYFGEMALLGSQRRSGLALAIDDVVVTVTTQETFGRVAVSDPGFAVHLIKVMSERVRDIDKQLGGGPAAPAGEADAPPRGEDRGEGTRFFPAESVLFQSGERAAFCYVVTAGRVAKVDARDRARPAARQVLVGPGEIVGDVPFLLGRTHEREVRAVEDTTAFFLSRDSMRQAVKMFPDVYLKMAQGLAAKLQSRLDEIARRQLRELS